MKVEKQALGCAAKKQGEGEELSCEQSVSITTENSVAEAPSYGEFKSLAELLKAYRSLRSQFTKRSQRISELLKENRELKERLCAEQKNICCAADEKTASDICGNLADKRSDNVTNDIAKNTGSSAPSACLSDTAAEDETGNASGIGGATAQEFELPRDEYAAEAERFLRANPFACAYACEIADVAAKNGDLSHGFLERAFITVLGEKLKIAERNATSPDKIYEAAVANSEVYGRIIKRYLEQIEKNRGATLICSDGLPALAPPVKPKSIEEAGAFAVSVLKHKGIKI